MGPRELWRQIPWDKHLITFVLRWVSFHTEDPFDFCFAVRMKDYWNGKKTPRISERPCLLEERNIVWVPVVATSGRWGGEARPQCPCSLKWQVRSGGRMAMSQYSESKFCTGNVSQNPSSKHLHMQCGHNGGSRAPSLLTFHMSVIWDFHDPPTASAFSHTDAALP